MNEIQKILARAKASIVGQGYCPQRIFQCLAGKSNEDMIRLVKENWSWVWWLINNEIATPQELAKLGAINKADDNTGEITEGLWYVPKGITVERLSSGKVVKNYGNIEKQSGGLVRQNKGTIGELSGGTVVWNNCTIIEQSGGWIAQNDGNIEEQSGGRVEYNCGIISDRQKGGEK